MLKAKQPILVRILLLGVLAAMIPLTASAQSGPLISTGAPIFGNSGSTLFVFLPIVNTGSVTAASLQITGASFGSAHLLTPALPLAGGDVAANGSFGLPLAFDASNLTAGTKYLLTVRGTYQTTSGTLGFSVNRILAYGQVGFFAGAARPVTVVPTLDTADSATQIISAANGGAVQTTGADGSIFTLTIPPNALLSDESITMTPLLAVGSLPTSGGFVAGVQLAPEGLRFQQAATLTIQPAVSVPINVQLGFGYHGSGQEFYFQPLGLTQAITIPLLHFSGVGVAQGTPGNSGTPTSLEDRFDNAIAPIASEERAILFPTDPPGDTAAATAQAVALQAAGSALVGQLQGAVTDGSQAQSAIALINAWFNQVSIWNVILTNDLPVSLTAQLTGLIETLAQLRNQILANAYNQAFNQCLGESSDSARLLQAIQMEWAFNEAQNLQLPPGIAAGSGTAPPVFPDYPTQLAACIAGPIDFTLDSTVNGTQTVTEAQTLFSESTVDAQQIPLTFDTGSLAYTGNGPLNYQSHSFSIAWGVPGVSDCSSGVGNSGTIGVTATFDLNVIPNGISSPNQLRLHVTLVPNVNESDTTCATAGGVSESFTVTNVDYVTYLYVANGSACFCGTLPTNSPYFVNLNTPQEFNLSGTTSDSGVIFSAQQASSITLAQTSP